MKKVAIVQARLGSTRLPSKVLMPLMDKTVLEHVVDRLRQVPLIDEIVIATTIKASDDAIITEAERIGVAWYRGSEDHVLSRYYEAAKQYKADIVIRITSDCPVIDPEITNETIRFFLERKVDYASNTIERTFPRGLDTEVFTMEGLEVAYNEAHIADQYEHVTPYFYQNPNRFKLAYYTGESDYSHYRWTLDTEEDYCHLKEIYNHLYTSGHIFHWSEAVKLMEQYPALVDINKHIEQKKLNPLI
ncbi:glycosyltransferase family protein [Paenibacillus sp. YIM B09110]|uniref:glycosyltransferase family protein n=1 Tax=Paenibacillus sp. YIM B09110 TaxID=3126102 RepID=UPI00301DBE50